MSISHPVTLLTPEGAVELLCTSELSILDQAAARGLVLPAVCRGGACSTCAARLVAGDAPDQSEQSYLSEGDVEAGFVLLCVAYALGPCVLKTHQATEYLAYLAESTA